MRPVPRSAVWHITPPAWLITLVAVFPAGSALVALSLDGIGHPIHFDVYRMGATNLVGPHHMTSVWLFSHGRCEGMHFTYPPFTAFLSCLSPGSLRDYRQTDLVRRA